jgi:hypothetical protein
MRYSMRRQMSDAPRVTNTAVSNRRRSQRVFLKVRVVARFRLLERECIVDGDTIVVNAHGGTIYLSVAPMAPGDIITLTNPATDQSETCRVVRIDSMPARLLDPTPSRNSLPMPIRPSHINSDHGFEVAFAFDRPSPNFWAVAFPPTDWIESLVEH